MGNRAFIAPKGAENNLGIYLQWNGGRDSVEAFLRWAELAKLAPMSRSVVPYVTMIANFFGNAGLSVYVEPFDPENLKGSCPAGNGVYVIDGFEIVDRVHSWEDFTDADEQHIYDLAEMLEGIDAAQPERDRLGALLKATEVPTGDVKIGDTVLLTDPWGSSDGVRFKPYTVVGIGDDGWVDGVERKGVPYVNKYGDNNPDNLNNFLRDATSFVMKGGDE